MAAAAAAPSSASDVRLPCLRAEIELLSGHDGRDGAVLFDPLRMRYFRIDRRAAHMLSLWMRCATAGDLVLAMDERFGAFVTADEIEALAAFLSQNQLIVPASEKDWRLLLASARRERRSWLSSAIHNYLFAKFPLVRPQRALEWLAVRLAWLYTPAAALTVVAMGLVGLYLVSRQWDAFLATFSNLMSLQGALHYAIAIIIVKSLHELGHAVTAARYGCRVPSMGICFMVLVPMLYTDVTDAWRLPSARQRLAIDAGGVIVELALACIATLLWAFLPDGTARSIAFATATTGWVLSLVMNLNPLMRFDGYYILSDLTRTENLQPRAFAMGTWWLREALFALGAPPPERLAPRTRRWLIVYAYAVWLYRVVLFTGIALLVYYMTFKVLGIALFVIEIAVFIALPIWREFLEWHRMRARIFASRRFLLTACFSVAALGAALVPWSSSIAIPAVMDSDDLQQAFPARPAVVREFHVDIGRTVAAGDVLALLESPELEHDLMLTERRLRLVEGRLARRAGDQRERAETLVLEDMRASLEARRRGLQEQRSELRIVSDRAGTIVEAEPHLHAGRWLKSTDIVALVRGPGADVVRGYIAEDRVALVDVTRPARFVPEDPLAPSRSVTLTRIADTGTSAMQLPELASHYGGGVEARRKPGSGTHAGTAAEHIPTTGQFMVVGYVSDRTGGTTSRVERGTLHAQGKGESLAARVWRQVLKVLVRESGF